MFTFTASVGQSVSQGMQYQHSSYFIWALPVSGLIHRTSSGQTSMHTRQPLSAMHLSSSTTTGTLERWLARGMVFPSNCIRLGERPWPQKAQQRLRGQGRSYRLDQALAAFLDRKSTRLNSSHSQHSYALFLSQK